MIDPSKKYRTKGGYEVKLNFIDGETVYGHFECWKDSWFGGEWNINDGIYSKSGDPECDLVEVKPRIKKTVWMNIYESDDYFIWPTKSEADLSAEVTKVKRGVFRIACIKVEIDCEEGEGL